MTSKPVEIFFSYSHKDEPFREQLETHLSMLKRQGLIKPWHDRMITAGDEWKGQIDENLNAADIVLLLVTANFLASDYCYDIEMKRAMERYEIGEALVIPIILTSVEGWTNSPFAKLQVLPKDGKPVTKWNDRDEAFVNVVQGIRRAIDLLPQSKFIEQSVFKQDELSPSFAQRLKLIYEGKEKEWEYTHTLLTSLRQARLLEQNPLKQIKSDEEIKIIEQKLSEITQELSELEKQFSHAKGSPGIDEISKNPEHTWNPTLDNSDVGTFSPEMTYEDIEAIYETLPEEVKAMIEELRHRLERAKGKTFTFLLIGKTGVGKSSTVNSLMGATVAPVGDFDPCTTNVTIHETNLHEAIVRVIDTPGLCDEVEEKGNDAKYLELIRQKISYAIDAVLFVSRLDDNRVDASEKRGLRLITEAFGELFWKKAVIVFTHSDKVSDERFEEYLRERTKRIHAQLLTHQLSNDTVYSIPSVAVNNTNIEKVNPDGQKWIQQLYLTLLDRIEIQDSKDVFMLSTSHMVEKIGLSPLSVIGKTAGVAGMAAGSGQIGAFLAYLLGVGSTSVGTIMGPHGAILTGLFLINNPIGWAIVLGSAVGGGYYAYRAVKD